MSVSDIIDGLKTVKDKWGCSDAPLTMVDCRALRMAIAELSQRDELAEAVERLAKEADGFLVKSKYPTQVVVRVIGNFLPDNPLSYLAPTACEAIIKAARALPEDKPK